LEQRAGPQRSDDSSDRPSDSPVVESQKSFDPDACLRKM
jgi:hypothetical protein